jgi:hypothetical protein
MVVNTCVFINIRVSRIFILLRNKKSQPKKLTFKVENTGFEPVASCMPCKRSSQLS